ncbi:MAG: 16S rRNA (cytidine(1402)-2'-O)-methyltransferase [Pseudomonadota bacterium]
MPPESSPRPLCAGIYIVATPIGNLNDISFRAENVLKNADLVAAEDTRVTGKLLKHIGAATPMQRYDDHATEAVRARLIERAAHEAVALVTDAGTPLIADPGYRLVSEARAADIAITSIPGPVAFVTALTLAGLPTDRVMFAGFAPPKAKARADALNELASLRATLVFYESGPRLARFLAAAADALGDRRAVVARELTKLYEEIRDGTLAGLAAHYEADGAPKGEIVVVISPPAAQPAPSEADLDAALSLAMAETSLKSAVRDVTDRLGLPRAAVYARALALKDR